MVSAPRSNDRTIVCVAVVAIEAECKRAIRRRGIQNHSKLSKAQPGHALVIEEGAASNTCWNQRAAAGKSCTRQCTWEIFIEPPANMESVRGA